MYQGTLNSFVLRATLKDQIYLSQVQSSEPKFNRYSKGEYSSQHCSDLEVGLDPSWVDDPGLLVLRGNAVGGGKMRIGGSSGTDPSAAREQVRTCKISGPSLAVCEGRQ